MVRTHMAAVFVYIFMARDVLGLVIFKYFHTKKFVIYFVSVGYVNRNFKAKFHN